LSQHAYCRTFSRANYFQGARIQSGQITGHRVAKNPPQMCCQIEHRRKKKETIYCWRFSRTALWFRKKMQSVVQEIDEMLAMTVASIKILRARFFFNPKSKVRILESQCAA
jgi:hypothetical protein